MGGGCRTTCASDCELAFGPRHPAKRFILTACLAQVPIAEFYGKGAPRINYLADVSRDRSVAVRRKFVHVLTRWCIEMDGEDLYEQEVRLGGHLIIIKSSVIIIKVSTRPGGPPRRPP